jgi:ABC-2 type transport system permease protein
VRSRRQAPPLTSMSTLRRLFQLWGLYARMDILYLTRGPLTALAFYVSDVAVGTATVTATFLLAERFNGLGPWSKKEVIFLLGYALVVRGTIDIFCNYNIGFISRRIGRGQLDHVLVQPQPMWLVLLTEGFAPITGAGMFVPGVSLLIWSIVQLQLPLSPAWLLLFLVNVLASVAIVLSFSYAWASLAFWAPRAAEEVNSSTWQLIMQLNVFPLEGLPGAVLAGLLSVVPVGFVAWWAGRIQLGPHPHPWAVAILPVLAVLFLAVCGVIFTRGLAHYGRVGSTRYVAYGHRR